jgi:hypothetical protein
LGPFFGARKATEAALVRCPKLAGVSLARVYFLRGDTFDENVMTVWALE